MKAGDIVKHKLTGEKLIVIQCRNWETEPYTLVRRRNWDIKYVYKEEIEEIKKGSKNDSVLCSRDPSARGI